MYFSTMSIAALSLGSVLAGPVSKRDLAYSTASWTGTIAGELVTFNGTAQEVHAQIAEHYPNEVLAVKEGEVLPLEKRNKLGANCIQNYGLANPGRIQEGINYLNGRGGTWYVNGHSCALISCSYNAGITLCNDNNFGINPAGRYLSTYAQDIKDRCTYNVQNGEATSGQEFDTDSYNIIVGNVRC